MDQTNKKRVTKNTSLNEANAKEKREILMKRLSRTWTQDGKSSKKDEMKKKNERN